MIRLTNPLLACVAMAALAGLAAPLPAQQASAPAEGVSGLFSWQAPHAKVLPQGDLEWAPRPFVFEKGSSLRYIDFEAGDDANPGDSKDKPWKHHPWDASAAGKAKECSGIQTYVFKRGSIYRGALVARESGKPGDPIRLTSDPSWGRGEAVICGAEKVIAWKKGADRADIPEPAKVWYADLDFAPRCVWRVEKDGNVVRIPLARTPNWNVSDEDDVKSQWWSWDCKGVKAHDNFTQKGNLTLHLGVDTAHLTRPADYYQDAVLWTEHGWVSGAPYPIRVETFDSKKKGLGFTGRFGGLGMYKIIKGCRYFLEDKPQYLDDPAGEFWFDKKGPGGRLYLRLPEGLDPASADIEAARHLNLIDSEAMSHVHVTGLAFRFTNIYWKLSGVPYEDGKALDPACIRLYGPGKDIRVANCLFEHVNTAVRMRAVGKGSAIDQVVISDNEVNFADRGGFHLANGAKWGEALPELGFLLDVKVLRNKLRFIGLRPTRFDLGVAIEVKFARTPEVAGNILDRCYSQGIDVQGAKASFFDQTDCPLSRILIHHNKVTDSLLSNDDYGGIETWQGGPAYVYDNISGNPGGYRNFGLSESNKPGWARFGHAYYLDGAFKNYYFNNIAWGKSKDPFSPLGNSSAFQEIISYQNTFFNNTIYNFVKGTRRQAPQAGRDKFLGNVWQGIGEWVFWHSQPAKSDREVNAADAGPESSQYATETNAYCRNVFYDIPKWFGVLEASGRWIESLDAFAKVLEDHKALASGVGVIAAAAPLRDPAKFDFRPAPGSPGIGKGVKVFVPWALYAEVAEWNFYRCGGEPAQVLDEHWTMTPYHTDRAEYYRRPTFPLSTVNMKAEDFVHGPLEDWTAGALKLNGTSQYAAVPGAKFTEPVQYEVRLGMDPKATKETRTASGPDLKNPQIHTSNFLIEAYFRTEPGHTGGVLVEKMGGAGYSLAVGPAGCVAFSAQGKGGTGSVAGKTKINDGRWHHVIAEADRASATLTLYVDGRKDASAAGVGAGVTLANDADLYVGGTPKGRCLAGTLDFVRIALGTLADAATTIEELYAWEFDGPASRDFCGRSPIGPRDAGAIQYVPPGAGG
jgi:hypothetical protein